MKIVILNNKELVYIQNLITKEMKQAKKEKRLFGGAFGLLIRKFGFKEKNDNISCD
jgi:hypothetical protein